MKPLHLSERRMAWRAFSLVEMLTAMSILVIMMGILFQFISKAQQIWTTDSSNAEIYENARLFFDVISRDLQGMVVDDINGQNINYSVDSTELPADFKLAFVTSSGIGVQDTDSSRLLEVGYLFNRTDSEIVRYMSNSGAFSNSEWNFYNALPTIWAASSSWTDNTVLAEGVRSLEITLYENTTTAISNATADTTAIPAYAVVEAQFFDKDKKLLPTSEIDKTVRSFSKIIFLNRGD